MNRNHFPNSEKIVTAHKTGLKVHSKNELFNDRIKCQYDNCRNCTKKITLNQKSIEVNCILAAEGSKRNIGLIKHYKKDARERCN